MTNGPVPKRSEHRVRRNADIQVDTIQPVEGAVEAPEPVEGWHPLVTDLWDAMTRSAQARYYEPSDWHFAKIQLHLLSQQLNRGQASAQMMATLNTALTNLLLTEGDRRRVRLEVEREVAKADVVDIASELAKRQAR